MLALFLAVAHAATWPFRGPVPVEPVTDGAPFSLCLELGVELGFTGDEFTQGNVTHRCLSDAGASRVCYQVDSTPWPDSWPALECRGDTTRVVVQLIPAFHPRMNLDKGVVISRRVDEAAAVFEVGSAFGGQRVEGQRGTICEVSDGKLFVSRRGSSRRKDYCELRTATGEMTKLPIRFRSKVPSP